MDFIKGKTVFLRACSHGLHSNDRGARAEQRDADRKRQKGIEVPRTRLKQAVHHTCSLRMVQLLSRNSEILASGSGPNEVVPEKKREIEQKWSKSERAHRSMSGGMPAGALQAPDASHSCPLDP